jgi:hypothetical protein
MAMRRQIMPHQVGGQAKLVAGLGEDILLDYIAKNG